jgi:phosphatidylinositol glycan class V
MPRPPRPLALLTVLFVAWKGGLLLAALLSPGRGYDSSASAPAPLADGRIRRLVRWDAVYFAAIARRGYRFEQEWAFGWGFTRVLAGVAAGMGLFSLLFPFFPFFLFFPPPSCSPVLCVL